MKWQYYTDGLGLSIKLLNVVVTFQTIDLGPYKFQIPNKFFFIEKKNQFSKMTKKIKRTRIKIDIKNESKFMIEG
jgi:hypothetical protein